MMSGFSKGGVLRPSLFVDCLSFRMGQTGFSQLHILRGCPTTHDVRFQQGWCNETFTVRGLLELEDGTDRFFLNVGN